MNADQKYAALISEVLAGPVIDTRNSPTRRAICRPVEFDSVPLVTTRRTAWRNALREMEWFLSGSNNINDLHTDVRKWWDPWADQWGCVPFNYGEQFRRMTHVNSATGHVGTFDQIAYLLDGVRGHPYSRRNVVTTWLTGEMADPACPITNCHGTVIQVFGTPIVRGGAKIDLFMYQRSCDLILGVPHNWVQYWAFLLWLAHRTGTQPGKFIWTGGDVHVYAEHEPVAREIVDNQCSADGFAKPTMLYVPSGDDFKAGDFSIPYTPPAVVTTPVRMIV